MTPPYILVKALRNVKRNSPELLTGTGVIGVIATSYLTGKAAFEAAKVLDGIDTPADRTERIKEQIKQTWRLYIPAGVSGIVTIASIVGVKKTSGQKTAAAVAAYSLAEKAFSDYREKVVEQIGENKERAIRDEIAQDKVTRYPTTSREVIVVGGGHVLCCELMTNRYFRSDMETIRKAVNDINAMIINNPYVTVEEFYELIGLPRTSVSGDMGWDSDKLLELQFSTVMAEGNEPCLAFDYNYIKPID